MQWYMHSWIPAMKINSNKRRIPAIYTSGYVPCTEIRLSIKNVTFETLVQADYSLTIYRICKIYNDSKT